jgi:hypothetical protein
MLLKWHWLLNNPLTRPSIDGHPLSQGGEGCRNRIKPPLSLGGEGPGVRGFRFENGTVIT